MSRQTRRIERVFKIFCEGDTEYNYFDEMRRQLRLKIALKPVNMKGGGYTNFLESIRVDSNTNCLAKFVVVDGDRAINDVNEKRKLKELLDYCIIQNKCGRTPHFLIVNVPDFEYIACLHSPSYRGKSVSHFIIEELGYKNIDDFKADKKVYNVLNSKGNSMYKMLEVLGGKDSFVVNRYTVNKSMLNIVVRTTYDWDKLANASSNIGELFELVL